MGISVRRGILACAAAAALAAPSGAGAALLVVNSLGDDTTPSDGLVTLREAIVAAETDGTTDLGDAGSGADVITFDAALTAGGDAVIAISTVGDGRYGPAAFGITTAVHIEGPAGDDGITLQRSGGAPLRFFNVGASGDLTLENLTLSGGLAEGGDGGTSVGQFGGGGGGGAGMGGAIFSEGHVEILSSTLSGNTARGGDGGAGALHTGDGAGGGAGGGGLGGDGADIASGLDGGGGGGGSRGTGGAPSASAGGGGGGTQTAGGNAVAAVGGTAGVQNGGVGGSLTFAGAPGAGPGGGGGGGAADRNGGAGHFGGGGGGTGDALVVRTAGAGGFGGGGGGGGRNANGGAGGFGGGGGGAARDTLAGTGALGGLLGGNAPGGVLGIGSSSGGGGGAGLGGAIVNLGGTIVIHNSTLSGNTAIAGVGGPSPTFTTATAGQTRGGALFNFAGQADVENATFAGNAAAFGSDVFNLVHPDVAGASDVAIRHSLFASLVTPNVSNQVVGAAASAGTIQVTLPSLVGAGTSNDGGTFPTGAMIVAPPGIFPLADNGGPTATHAPVFPASPAIDAAASGPGADQRGHPRPDGGDFDIGAVEVEQQCGDGFVQELEECDDGNTVENDGCSNSCELGCDRTPVGPCVGAASGSISIDERKPGAEKLKIALKKLLVPVVAADFGDPVAGDTVHRVCVYDHTSTLQLDIEVDRSADFCGTAECWKAPPGKPLVYADPLAAAEGIFKIGAKPGAARKGSIVIQGKNDPKKGLTALPTGVAAGMTGSTLATVRFVATDGQCFEASFLRVTNDTGLLFKAKPAKPF